MTQTTNDPITLEEISAPNLGLMERVTLVTALNLAMFGLCKVSVAVTYSKQTDTPPRIPGRDFIALPGVSREAQMGEITRVFRRKKDNAVRFNIRSHSRPNGRTPHAPTTMIPAGLNQFVVTALYDYSSPNVPHISPQAQPI